MSVLVGTAGWRHATWRGTFYPEHLWEHPDLWLRHYAERFPLVELPIPPDLAGYPGEARTFADVVRGITPFEFVPALPASWGLHALTASVREAGEMAETVCEQVARPFKNARRLGVLLITIPEGVARSPASEESLETVVHSFFEWDVPSVVEFHDRSWLDPTTDARGHVVGYGDLAPEVSATLLEANAALVIPDGPGWPTRERVDTATHAYVRFLGRNYDVWDRPGAGDPEAYDTAPVETRQALGTRANRYDYPYGLEELKEWVPFIEDLDKATGRVRVVFGNTPGARAALNARELMDLLGSRAVTPAPRARAVQT